MPIALADLLDSKNVALDLRTGTAEKAIRRIVAAFAATEQIRDPEKFVEQVLAREQANPSVVEHGVVFPHARTDLVENIVLGIGRSRAGIPFAQGGRAHLIFLIGVPRRLVSDYLVCLGALARILKNDETRARLLQSETAEEFVETLRRAAE